MLRLMAQDLEYDMYKTEDADSSIAGTYYDACPH